MAKDIAVVLCDGSLNACVTAAVAAQQHRLVLVHGLPAPAGFGRRQAAFELLCSHFKPYRQHTVPADFLLTARLRSAAQAVGVGGAGTGSAPVAIPSPVPDSLHQRMNDLFAMAGIGARFAYAYGAVAIYHGLRIGPDGGEQLGLAAEFNQILAEMLNMPLGQTTLEVQSPLLELEAWQVVDLGVQVSAPLEKAWSCHEDGAVPCQVCRGCRERAAAFDRAAKRDPQRRQGK